jgi:hypothetical protein
MSETLAIGDLAFALRWSARRSTIGITIDRSGSLILTAPEQGPASRLSKWSAITCSGSIPNWLSAKRFLRPQKPKSTSIALSR